MRNIHILINSNRFINYLQNIDKRFVVYCKKYINLFD